MSESIAPAADTPARRAFYGRISQKHMTPLWVSLANLVRGQSKGFKTACYRSTDATVFVAAEGLGRTRIGAHFVVDWQPRDVFVEPLLAEHVEKHLGQIRRNVSQFAERGADANQRPSVRTP